MRQLHLALFLTVLTKLLNRPTSIFYFLLCHQLSYQLIDHNLCFNRSLTSLREVFINHTL